MSSEKQQRALILSGLIYDMCQADDTYWSNGDVMTMVGLFRELGYDNDYLQEGPLKARLGDLFTPKVGESLEGEK